MEGDGPDLEAPEIQAAIQAAVEKAAGDVDAKIEAAKAGLVAKNQELIKEKRQLAKRASAIPELPDDFDVDEWKRMREAEQKQAEQQELEKGNFEKVKQDMAERAKQEAANAERLLAEEKGRTDAAQKRYEEYFIRGELTREILKADGIPDLLMSKIRSEVEYLHGEDGQPDAVRVVDSSGNEITKDASGETFQLADLLAKLKLDPVWARAFKGSGATGSGANGSGASGGAAVLKNPWKKDTLNLTEQARLLRDEPVLAERMKAEANT